jgi:AraC-like DNA-binding protein
VKRPPYFSGTTMLFDFNIYSSLLLIFFVHGVVYAILCWRKAIQNEDRSNYWLGVFLFLCSLYIFPWMMGFAGWYDHQPYRDALFYIPFQHLFFVGPVIFFYVQSLLNPGFRFGKREWLHLVPGILYLVYSAVVYITDYWVLDDYYFLADQSDRDFDLWYQLAGFFSMLVYFFLSLRYYRLYRRLMVQVTSYADALVFRWVQRFLIAFLAMLLFWLGFFFFGKYIRGQYIRDWWYYLSFAILMYYIAITGYSNGVITKVPFVANLLSYKPMLLLPSASVPVPNVPAVEEANYIEIEQPSELDTHTDTVVESWKEKISRAVIEGKAYENGELSLTELAQQLQTNPSHLSKMVNRGFAMNFNDFINYHRVQAVVAKLQTGVQQQQTLTSIAYDCGFNSKATFNRAFKKATGKTPQEYLKDP